MIQRWRSLRAAWRDTLILLNEFRTPVIIFTLIVVGGGLYYNWLAAQLGEPVRSKGEAVFTILSAAFLQGVGDFPVHPRLQVFHFVMPLIGVIILAQGLADFGSLLFNRRSRSKEWEMAVASTLENHIVLVGLGHLGYRIVEALYEMGKDVAVIELDPAVDAFKSVQKMGVPVIQEDAVRSAALEAANIAEAHTIILASQKDSMNLQIALKARSVNPDIKVVIRIFDEDFAHALHDQFGFIALSATEMAAPVFAAAAAGTDVTQPISIEGQQLSLARMAVSDSSALINKTVDYIEDTYHITVILLRQNDHSEMHPSGNKQLHAGDTIAVLGGPDQLKQLLQENQ